MKDNFKNFEKNKWKSQIDKVLEEFAFLDLVYCTFQG